MSKRVTQARTKVPILDLLAHFGFRVRPVGRKQWIGCHLHGSGQDHKPSAAVYPDTNSWYCWGCGKSRNTIQTVMDCQGLGFAEALSWLEHRFGLERIEEDLKESLSNLSLTPVLDPTETSEQRFRRIRNLLSGSEDILSADRRVRLWLVYDMLTAKLHKGEITEQDALVSGGKLMDRFYKEIVG